MLQHGGFFVTRGPGFAEMFVTRVVRVVALGQVLLGKHAAVYLEGEDFGLVVEVVLVCIVIAPCRNFEGLILDRLKLGPA